MKELKVVEQMTQMKHEHMCRQAARVLPLAQAVHDNKAMSAAEELALANAVWQEEDVFMRSFLPIEPSPTQVIWGKREPTYIHLALDQSGLIYLHNGHMYLLMPEPCLLLPTKSQVLSFKLSSEADDALYRGIRHEMERMETPLQQWDGQSLQDSFIYLMDEAQKQAVLKRCSDIHFATSVEPFENASQLMARLLSGEKVSAYDSQLKALTNPQYRFLILQLTALAPCGWACGPDRPIYSQAVFELSKGFYLSTNNKQVLWQMAEKMREDRETTTKAIIRRWKSELSRQGGLTLAQHCADWGDDKRVKQGWLHTSDASAVLDIGYSAYLSLEDLYSRSYNAAWVSPYKVPGAPLRVSMAELTAMEQRYKPEDTSIGCYLWDVSEEELKNEFDLQRHCKGMPIDYDCMVKQGTAYFFREKNPSNTMAFIKVDVSPDSSLQTPFDDAKHEYKLHWGAVIYRAVSVAIDRSPLDPPEKIYSSADFMNEKMKVWELIVGTKAIAAYYAAFGQDNAASARAMGYYGFLGLEQEISLFIARMSSCIFRLSKERARYNVEQMNADLEVALDVLHEIRDRLMAYRIRNTSSSITDVARNSKEDLQGTLCGFIKIDAPQLTLEAVQAACSPLHCNAVVLHGDQLYFANQDLHHLIPLQLSVEEKNVLAEECKPLFQPLRYQDHYDLIRWGISGVAQCRIINDGDVLDKGSSVQSGANHNVLLWYQNGFYISKPFFSTLEKLEVCEATDRVIPYLKLLCDSNASFTSLSFPENRDVNAQMILNHEVVDSSESQKILVRAANQWWMVNKRGRSVENMGYCSANHFIFLRLYTACRDNMSFETCRVFAEYQQIRQKIIKKSSYYLEGPRYLTRDINNRVLKMNDENGYNYEYACQLGRMTDYASVVMVGTGLGLLHSPVDPATMNRPQLRGVLKNQNGFIYYKNQITKVDFSSDLMLSLVEEQTQIDLLLPLFQSMHPGDFTVTGVDAFNKLRGCFLQEAPMCVPGALVLMADLATMVHSICHQGMNRSQIFFQLLAKLLMPFVRRSVQGAESGNYPYTGFALLDNENLIEYVPDIMQLPNYEGEWQHYVFYHAIGQFKSQREGDAYNLKSAIIPPSVALPSPMLRLIESSRQFAHDLHLENMKQLLVRAKEGEPQTLVMFVNAPVIIGSSLNTAMELLLAEGKIKETDFPNIKQNLQMACLIAPDSIARAGGRDELVSAQTRYAELNRYNSALTGYPQRHEVTKELVNNLEVQYRFSNDYASLLVMPPKMQAMVDEEYAHSQVQSVVYFVEPENTIHASVVKQKRQLALDLEYILFRTRHYWTYGLPLEQRLTVDSLDNTLKQRFLANKVALHPANREQVLNSILIPSLSLLRSLPEYCITEKTIRLLDDAALLVVRYNQVSMLIARQCFDSAAKPMLLNLKPLPSLPEPEPSHFVEATSLQEIREGRLEDGVPPEVILSPSAQIKRDLHAFIAAREQYRPFKGIILGCFFQTSQEKNRNANVSLARKLVAQLETQSLDAVFSQNLKKIRRIESPTLGRFSDHGINSVDLNKIIAAARRFIKNGQGKDVPERTSAIKLG